MLTGFLLCFFLAIMMIANRPTFSIMLHELRIKIIKMHNVSLSLGHSHSHAAAYLTLNPKALESEQVHTALLLVHRHQLTDRYMNLLAFLKIYQSINQSISQSIYRSIDRSIYLWSCDLQIIMTQTTTIVLHSTFLSFVFWVPQIAYFTN